MHKQILFLMAGLSLAVSSVGCCCLGAMGMNRGCNCGCPPAGGGSSYYPPTTGMYQSADPSQLAYSSTSVSQTAYAGGITQTAAAPAPIMGQPIYNAAPGTYTAYAPTQSLPTY